MESDRFLGTISYGYCMNVRAMHVTAFEYIDVNILITEKVLSHGQHGAGLLLRSRKNKTQHPTKYPVRAIL